MYDIAHQRGKTHQQGQSFGLAKDHDLPACPTLRCKKDITS